MYRCSSLRPGGIYKMRTTATAMKPSQLIRKTVNNMPKCPSITQAEVFRETVEHLIHSLGGHISITPCHEDREAYCKELLDAAHILELIGN